MAHTLVLIRHAKSGWSEEDLSDHARPLNDRGRAAAPLIGHALAERGVFPDEVLCSTARRTRETWEGIASALPNPPEPELIDGLYHAEAETMLTLLNAAKGDTVAIIGHNPGMGSLAHRLVRQPAPHPRFIDYPTGAVTIARVEEWARLGFKTADFVDFFVPRDLPGHP